MNSLPCGKRKSTISQKAASIELWNLHNTPSIFTKEILLLLFASKYYHQIPSRRKRVANQQISFFDRIYFQDREKYGVGNIFAATLRFGNILAPIRVGNTEWHGYVNLSKSWLWNREFCAMLRRRTLSLSERTTEKKVLCSSRTQIYL